MSTKASRTAARLMISPAVLLLLGWMIVPLSMTLYFSFLRYNLLMPGMESWAGFENYRYFFTDPAFWPAMRNTLVLVGGVLAITTIGGILLALLLDQPFWGQNIVRLLDRLGAGLEEHVHEPGERHLRLARPRLRPAAL
jgi:sorbitol/mannitol transport system permease protein